LDWHFLQQELLDAFNIIYPQYWKQLGVEESFGHHLFLIKNFYSYAKLLNVGMPSQEGKSFYTTPEMLSSPNLDNQQGMFKVEMKANSKAACALVPNVNPIIAL